MDDQQPFLMVNFENAPAVSSYTDININFQEILLQNGEILRQSGYCCGTWDNCPPGPPTDPVVFTLSLAGGGISCDVGTPDEVRRRMEGQQNSPQKDERDDGR